MKKGARPRSALLCWLGHLFPANFFKKWSDLGENEKHFAAAAGLQKKLFVERPVQHERRNHIPIAPDLAKPGVFLAGKRVGDFQEISGALRPELRPKPTSCLAHLRFAAEVVEF